MLASALGAEAFEVQHENLRRAGKGDTLPRLFSLVALFAFRPFLFLEILFLAEAAQAVVQCDWSTSDIGNLNAKREECLVARTGVTALRETQVAGVLACEERGWERLITFQMFRPLDLSDNQRRHPLTTRFLCWRQWLVGRMGPSFIEIFMQEVDKEVVKLLCIMFAAVVHPIAFVSTTELTKSCRFDVRDLVVPQIPDECRVEGGQDASSTFPVVRLQLLLEPFFHEVYAEWFRCRERLQGRVHIACEAEVV